MSGITTHILELSTGRPADGVAVVLERRGDDGAWAELGRTRTDANGRAQDLLSSSPPAAGIHRLTFATGDFYARTGTSCFHPEVVVQFRVDDPAEHHHVPLLLSPFGYSTYRGS
jgi:5-hydroxyisourate hydrolase